MPPVKPCSSRSRSKIRFAVCCCFFGRDLSSSRIRSIIGINGSSGGAGRNIIELLSRLEMPIVTTLHTVLPQPTPIQRDVMRRIIDTSTKIVVMSEKGREFLRSVHGAPARKIEVIPHGIPDFPFLESHHAKEKFGFSGKTV